MTTFDNIQSIETIAVIGTTEIVRVAIAAFDGDGTEWGDAFAEPARVVYATRTFGGDPSDFTEWCRGITPEELIAMAITDHHLKADPSLLVDQAMDIVLPLFPRLRKGTSGYVIS